MAHSTVGQMQKQRIAAAKERLLSPAERADLEAQYGKAVGAIIDAKLETKAQELVERYSKSWQGIAADLAEGDFPREELLISRERAAELLGVSLSTVQRMETSGELPKPIKINERVVRHRLVHIERVASGKPFDPAI